MDFRLGDEPMLGKTKMHCDGPALCVIPDFECGDKRSRTPVARRLGQSHRVRGSQVSSLCAKGSTNHQLRTDQVGAVPNRIAHCPDNHPQQCQSEWGASLFPDWGPLGSVLERMSGDGEEISD